MTLSVPAVAGAAQKRGSEFPDPGESESEPEFTIKVPVNVVPVNVTVTDKSGRFVTDLTADDFKLFEDGKPQRIQSFEIESSQPLASPEPVDPGGAAAAETGTLQPLQSFEGEPGKLISFFVDDLTERSVKFFGWVISALQEFMEEEMGPRDQVGVFSASGSVRIAFTGDRELLRDRIDDLDAGKLNLLRPLRTMSDVRAIRIVEGDLKGRVSDTTEFEAWRQYNEVQASIHRLLASLRQHLRYLQHFRGSKSLVLLSEGFVPARPMRWRVDRMVDQALRSRVTLNAVDIKGLDTAPLSTDIAFGDFPLERLAEDTGGIFYRASNDLAAGFRQIRDAQSLRKAPTWTVPNRRWSSV
ncbi:MAG: VWA domain-containing protein [Acidobacteriota bacterium]|nr:VWA domain-containing protein [Acidobacteriota bacterium]